VGNKPAALPDEVCVGMGTGLTGGRPGGPADGMAGGMLGSEPTATGEVTVTGGCGGSGAVMGADCVDDADCVVGTGCVDAGGGVDAAGCVDAGGCVDGAVCVGDSGCVDGAVCVGDAGCVVGGGCVDGGGCGAVMMTAADAFGAVGRSGEVPVTVRLTELTAEAVAGTVSCARSCRRADRGSTAPRSQVAVPSALPQPKLNWGVPMVAGVACSSTVTAGTVASTAQAVTVQWACWPPSMLDGAALTATQRPA